MGIKKLAINKDNISKITEPKQKSNRIIFNRIGYCSLKPITDEERIYKIKEGLKEVSENIRKSPNKLKVKNALSGEFNHVHF